MHYADRILGHTASAMSVLALGILAQCANISFAASPASDGIPVGITSDGFPYRGNAAAPVTLIEYTDYLCPFCAQYFQRTLPTLLDKYGRSGSVRFVMRDMPLASLHPGAPQGAVAATCVADQSAGAFWRMHDTLFTEQQQWNRLPDPADFLATAAKRASVDITAYTQCVQSPGAAARVAKSVAAAEALGFNGTPTFQLVSSKTNKTYTLVGAQPTDVFVTWIDALLAGKEPPEEKPAEKPELPFWAKPEGLAPDPARPGYTMAGDAYKGNPNARMVMVQFDDFQCPSCQRHATTTQSALDKQFVDTGEILWVEKAFPLRMHAKAPAAAAAARCAGDQGKFWPMHDVLFDRSDRWSSPDEPDAALIELASEIGLDAARFRACLTSRKGLEAVLRDIYDGNAVGIRNVPTFIVFYAGTGQVLVGTRTTDEFATTLRNLLDKSKSSRADSMAKN